MPSFSLLRIVNFLFNFWLLSLIPIKPNRSMLDNESASKPIPSSFIWAVRPHLQGWFRSSQPLPLHAFGCSRALPVITWYDLGGYALSKDRSNSLSLSRCTMNTCCVFSYQEITHDFTKTCSFRLLRLSARFCYLDAQSLHCCFQLDAWWASVSRKPGKSDFWLVEPSASASSIPRRVAASLRALAQPLISVGSEDCI